MFMCLVEKIVEDEKKEGSSRNFCKNTRSFFKGEYFNFSAFSIPCALLGFSSLFFYLSYYHKKKNLEKKQCELKIAEESLKEITDLKNQRNKIEEAERKEDIDIQKMKNDREDERRKEAKEIIKKEKGGQ